MSSETSMLPAEVEGLLGSLDIRPVLVDLGASGSAPEIRRAIAGNSIDVGFDPDSRELDADGSSSFLRSHNVPRAVTADGSPVAIARSGHDVVLVFGYENRTGRVLRDVDVGFSLHSATGQNLAVLYGSYTGKTYTVDNESGIFRCRVPRLPLAPGRYRVGGRIVIGGEEADWPNDGIGLLEVEGGDYFGTGHAGFGATAPVLLDGSWQ